jgi:hypothetical protein
VAGALEHSASFVEPGAGEFFRAPGRAAFRTDFDPLWLAEPVKTCQRSINHSIHIRTQETAIFIAIFETSDSGATCILPGWTSGVRTSSPALKDMPRKPCQTTLKLTPLTTLKLTPLLYT